MTLEAGVVIPLHDKQEFIGRAIDSVLQQTFKRFALTVVDDGSTDASAERVAEISDPRIRLIRTSCRGPGAARNAGLRATDASWVGLLDADDVWKPTFLERMLAAAHGTTRVVAVFSGIEARGRRSSRSRRVIAGPVTDYFAMRMRRDASLSSSSVLLHKATFLSIGGFREDCRYAEDLEAWFRLVCEGDIYHVPEPLAVIEVGHPGSITRSAAAGERIAGLEMLLSTCEAYRRSGRVRARLARSSRRFMEQQRARLALHLFEAGKRATALRMLLTAVPLGRHTWREYAHCAYWALRSSRV